MVWLCRSNHTSPEHTEQHSHRGRGGHHTWSTWSSTRAQFAWNHEQLATSLLLFQGFLPVVWELMFLLPPRTILIKVSGWQLWFFPRHFRGWPHCSHCDWRLPSVHLWQAQWSSQQWTAWQSMNHGGLAQVPSLDFVTRRSDLSAIITTACNKFSNINCTVPTLEPRITNTSLPPPSLWLHVFSTMHRCVNRGLTNTKLWEDAKTASQEDAERATKHLRKVLKRTVMEIHLYTSTHVLYFCRSNQHSPLQRSFNLW